MPIKDMPLTNRQHAVPQNIMDVEFKLIGDLTMRQFAYLFVTGGIAWIAFVSVGGIFKWPLVLVSVLLGLGLAFVPVEDRGLDQWVINFFKSVYSPTQKIWKKDPNVPAVFTYQDLAVVKQEMITLAPTSSRRKLEEYLEHQSSDVQLDKYDIAEQEYIKKVHDAFYDETHQLQVPVTLEEPEVITTTTTTLPDLAPPVAEPIVEPRTFTPPSQPEPAPMPEPVPAPQQESKPQPVQPAPQPKIEPVPAPKAPVQQQAPQINPNNEIAAAKPIIEISAPASQMPKPTPPQPVQVVQPKPISAPVQQPVPTPAPQVQQVQTPTPQPIQQVPEVKPNPQPVPQPAASEIVKPKTVMTPEEPAIIRHKMDLKRAEVTLSPITPDQHSGRRFTSLLPKQGEIVLPIRGEKVLKTSDQTDIEEDIQTKTAKLKDLINQIKQTEHTVIPPRKEEPVKAQVAETPHIPATNPINVSTPPVVEQKVEPKPEPKPIPQPAPPEADNKVVENFKSENQRMSEELERLRNELNSSKASAELEKQRKIDTLRMLEEEKQRASGIAAAQKASAPASEPIAPQQPPTVQVTYSSQSPSNSGSGGKPTAFTSIPTSSTSNVITGIVKDPNGSVIEGAVVMVKTANNEPKRAIKTNVLGQFSLVNPLANGEYKIEVIHNDKMDYSFDIISVSAKGAVIPPLEFIGKR